MNRIKIFPHGGINILYTDLSNLDVAEAKEVVLEAIEIVANHPKETVFSLVNVEELRFNKALIKAITHAAIKNTPYIKATAVVGLSSMTKLVANTVSKITQRNMKYFDDIEQAKNWLEDEGN